MKEKEVEMPCLDEEEFNDDASETKNGLDPGDTNTTLIDDVLLNLGSPGLFHVITYIILWWFNTFISYNHVALPSSFGITPPHSCAISNHYKGLFHSKYGINVSGNDLVYEQCLVRYNSSFTVACDDWVYHTNDGKMETLVTEWNLVCDRKYVPMVLTASYYVGVMVGGASIGHVSDRFGRRRCILIAVLVSAILGVGIAFSTNLYIFAILRFILGMLLCGAHNIIYVMSPEISARKFSNHLAISLILSFLGGVMIGDMVCWLTQSWWKSQLILTLPVLVPLTLAYYFLPESFRWLLAHKRYAESSRWLQKAAKINRKVLPPLTRLRSGTIIRNKVSMKTKHTLSSLFRYKEMRKRFLVISFISVSVAIAYYGLSFNVRNLSDNPYLSILLSASADPVPVIFLFFILHRFGKRRVALTFYIVGGVLAIVYKIYNHLAILIIGKMLFANAFGLTLIMSTELFPTVVRNLCVGACVTICRIGSVLAPAFVLLGTYTAPDIPVLVIGILMIMAGLLGIFLPESRGLPLPETVDDVENYKELLKEHKRKRAEE